MSVSLNDVSVFYSDLFVQIVWSTCHLVTSCRNVVMSYFIVTEYTINAFPSPKQTCPNSEIWRDAGQSRDALQKNVSKILDFARSMYALRKKKIDANMIEMLSDNELSRLGLQTARLQEIGTDYANKSNHFYRLPQRKVKRMKNREKPTVINRVDLPRD